MQSNFMARGSSVTNMEFVDEEDVSILISIDKLDYLQLDDVLDILEEIFTYPILNITIEEVVNDVDILDRIQEYQEDQ